MQVTNDNCSRRHSDHSPISTNTAWTASNFYYTLVPVQVLSVITMLLVHQITNAYMTSVYLNAKQS